MGRRHRTILFTVLASSVIMLLTLVLLSAGKGQQSPPFKISVVGSTNRADGIKALLVSFENIGARGFTIWYDIQSRKDNGWQEDDAHDDGAHIACYVPAGGNKTLTVRPPAGTNRWRILCNYNVGFQNRLERWGNWAGSKLGCPQLMTPDRAVAGPEIE